MSLKDIFRTIMPSVEDESCDFLLYHIFDNYNKNKAYRLTNVTPGLASLIKRRIGGDYARATKTFLINQDKSISPIEISCNMKDLEALLIKLKKGE